MKKICQICGDEFEAKSNRALYCEYCRSKAQVERNKLYAQKRSEGKAKRIGSVQICPFCKQEYTVRSGSQQCCDNCRQKQRYQRQGAEAEKYKKEHYDRLTVYVPKGKSDELKAAAAALGMSLNEYILAALDKFEGSRDK